MGVSVKSNGIPQPAQLKNAPHNSLNIPSNTAANMPLQNNIQQRVLPNLPKIATYLTEGTKRGLGYALGGLATVGAIGGGAMYLRRKRKEDRRKETDDLWRSAVLNQQGTE